MIILVNAISITSLAGGTNSEMPLIGWKKLSCFYLLMMINFDETTGFNYLFFSKHTSLSHNSISRIKRLYVIWKINEVSNTRKYILPILIEQLC